MALDKIQAPRTTENYQNLSLVRFESQNVQQWKYIVIALKSGLANRQITVEVRTLCHLKQFGVTAEEYMAAEGIAMRGLAVEGRGQGDQGQVAEGRGRRGEVVAQARTMVSVFINDRVQADGFQEQHQIEPLPIDDPELARQAGSLLKKVADEFDSDWERKFTRLSADDPIGSFSRIASAMFSDGVCNWGRVVTLFYCAYRLFKAALENGAASIGELLSSLVEAVVQFIVDNLAPWILSRGGWMAIREYFGTTNRQMAVVVGSGLVCGLLVFFKYHH